MVLTLVLIVGVSARGKQSYCKASYAAVRSDAKLRVVHRDLTEEKFVELLGCVLHIELIPPPIDYIQDKQCRRANTSRETSSVLCLPPVSTFYHIIRASRVATVNSCTEGRSTKT